MLKLTVKPGEYVLIGEEVKIVFAGGSAKNLRILVDAPKKYNIVRSEALERYGMAADPGNEVRHYPERQISAEAQDQINPYGGTETNPPGGAGNKERLG